MDFGFLFTKSLAIGTLLGNVFAILYLLSALFAKDLYRRVSRFLSERALALGFLVSFSATFGSILYSQVMGYPACILCWIQRIFMYPEAALFALAAWRKDRGVLPYALLLALLGGAVALYNWVKDMLALYTDIALACPAVPGLPSCDRIYVDEFGYITIPMLALNAFLLIIIITLAAMRADKSDRT